MHTKTYLLLLWIVVFFTSCQKEVSDTLPGIDPSDTTAPATGNAIRQIQVKGTYGSDPVDVTFTIQYDTPASKITVLMTNALPGGSSVIDPADKGIVYQFNAAGYLVKGDVLQTAGTLQPAFACVRNAANQIEKLIGCGVEEVNGVSHNDTTYYRFAPGLIEDSVRYAGSNDFFRTERRFNVQNQLQSVAHYFANELYHARQLRYDGQGNVIQIISTTDTTDYTYDTAAATWNTLPQLFLGKDAHVLMREAYGQFGYNFLSILIEDKWLTLYNPLFTQPLTRLVRHGYTPFDLGNTPTPTRSELTFTTTYTTDGKVRTITATPENNELLTFTFSY